MELMAFLALIDITLYPIELGGYIKVSNFLRIWDIPWGPNQTHIYPIGYKVYLEIWI
jgi:hypothetical protein